MSLRFGWVANETVDSIWKWDDSLTIVDPVTGEKTCRASAAALAGWREDGEASHLRPFCEGTPQIIRFRNLSPDETRVANAYWIDPANAMEGYSRVLLMCFRIGVDFVGLETIPNPDGSGSRLSIIVKERGVRMLAEPFVMWLETTYPGIVSFYGKFVYEGMVATEKEKKASSPPSTPTPSSAPESTVATTEPSPASPSAAGA